MDSIIRLSRKIANFTCIDNGIANDIELSLQERGLMLTVLSLPDNWEFNIRGLSKRCHESMPTIGKIIKGLIGHGYCKRRRLTDPKSGRVIRWEYIFYEVKNGLGCSFEPESNIPQVENPQCGKSTSGKVDTTKYYKELNNKEPNNKKSVFVPPTIEEVKAFWKEKNYQSDPELFWGHFYNCDWRLSNGRGAKMKSWKVAAVNWEKTELKMYPRSYGK